MKSSTLLDSAVFQLTPTRTRCDLIITANGKTEKIASGLLNPFLAHLKTAQDQIAKGGYSIILEPKPGSDATWFAKGTVERFVRFVSTPEVLERVYTIESEIIQIGEAIAIQSNNDLGLSAVVDHQAKPVESIEGSKPVLDTSEEKAIVLYKPGAHPPEANGSTTQEGNSKVQLLKVLETRKTVLQKEQGMAFARAVAAGFDIDHMTPLLSFAECFGASRLMDACLRFMDLWKSKHETGQWLEIEAAEAMSSRSDFSSMNPSGITLSNMVNKQKEFREAWPEPLSELASENNGKARIDASTDEKPPMDHQVPQGHQEYFQGQFPHHMFPPWPIHSPPGAVPVFQPYPMQGMPYYQNYPGNGSFVQPPYPPMEDSRFSPGYRMGQKRHSMDSRDSNTESETWDADASKTRSSYGLELEKEASQSPESRKKANRSGKKKSGVVVIRNINYITSKRQNSSGSESQSDSNETDEETGDLQMDASEMKHKSSLRSSKRKESSTKSMDASKSSDKEDRTYEKEPDVGHWQAFQSYLLRDADEDKHSVDQGMFAMEKGVKVKRRQSAVGDDPLAIAERDTGEIREGRMTEFHKISGNLTCRPKLSNDELLISGREGHSGGASGSTDGQMDVQYIEIDGRRVRYRRTSNDAFMIHGQENQLHFTTSTDPLAINGFEGTTGNLDRISNNMADESYIVPLRSIDQVEADDRNAIDMDSELPSALQNAENCSNRMGRQIDYEPDDLTLMPERGTEKGSTGYDPALEYEMQVHGKDAASLVNRKKEVVADAKQGPKKSDKDRRPKVSPDTLDKKKIVGATRKGKPSKLSPLEEARARAERLRTFKADLQKEKKEKEEEEMKRKETLKIERQKRIAARNSSIPAQSPLSSQQTRKRLPAKVSPSSLKGSKFSDSEPGSSSPLQRFTVRTASLGSGDSQKVSKPGRTSNGSHSAENRLSRSVSALPEPKKENNGLTPDPKVSMARIRRLSEPKMSSSHQVSSVKLRSAESVPKPKISDEPESKKISAIINLDRTKGATLPEIKIRTSKGPLDVVQNKSAAKEMMQKVNVTKSSGTTGGAELKRKDDKISTHCDMEENPVVEKTVVMLECEKPSVPVVQVSKEKMGAQEGQYDNYEVGVKTEVVSDYAAIRAPPSPLTMDGVDKEPIECQLQEQPSSYEAGLVTMRATGQPEGSLKLPSIKIAEKPYQAPFARNSSLEDPCTENSEYGKAPPTNVEMATTGADTVKALVSDFKDVKLEKIPEEKTQVKESKGFRRLLKFGRKSHSTAAGDRHTESDNGSINGSEADEYASNAASSSEVHTLKNLISQDETPTDGTTAQKSSRSFSLLSPFRSKTSDKKLTV